MTQDTQQLIDSLAQGAGQVKPMPSPSRLLLRLGMVLAVYAGVIGLILGLRPDIAVQLHRLLYVAEILLLLFIAVSSLSGAVYLTFPDEYQHEGSARLPLYATGAFILLLLVQAGLPADARMVINAKSPMAGMECTECIAAVAMLPSLLLFLFLRKGASLHPTLLGAYAVLAASAIGCLALRLSEANDSLFHLVSNHYLPTVLFAALGAFLGSKILKW